MSPTPFVLWGDQRQWPLTPPGYLFIVPAFNRIGRAMKGAAWNDQFPSVSLLPTPPLSQNSASPEMREYAHWDLLDEDGIEYTPKYNFTDLNSIGTVGSSALNTLGMPQTGYTFTDDEWAVFRKRCLRRAEVRQPIIAMTADVARWLYEAVVSRRLTPHLLKKSGGDWHAGNHDDWMMISLDQIQGRVRTTTMTPGNASSIAGSHYIFFAEGELDSAIKEIQPITDEEQKLLSNVGGAFERNVSSAAATDYIVRRLREDDQIPKSELLRGINSNLGRLSGNQFNSLYPNARVMAGLQRKAPPGRKKKRQNGPGNRLEE